LKELREWFSFLIPHLQEKITARIVFPVSFVRMNDAKSASKDATAKHHSRAQINAMKADIS
jgi:hypothetical protein